MDHVVTTFACGCALSAETVYAAKELDSLVEQGQENCGFIVYFQGAWYKYQFAGAWSAIAMATVKPPGQERVLVAISPGGAYWEVETRARRETHGGIKAAGHSLRSLAVIDEVVYACGMGRSVLRRNRCGDWRETGPGVAPGDAGRVVGFEGLAGFSADEIYAVGWGGEIWLRAASAWQRIDSPVSANLNAACCAADGKVYIVGDRGVMLRGRHDVWEVLETDRTDNLMDVACFNGIVYVTTDFEILAWRDETLVAEDAFLDDDPPATCLHLLTAEDALVSMGPKDLFRLQNNVWERLV